MTVTISYTGNNPHLDNHIREYVKDCKGIGKEINSGYFIPTGIRDIVFEGRFEDTADMVELEDIGVVFSLKIIES